ncbi:E3 ubiquitin-protein ligase TRIM71 [Oopsacas minuta]|uniref:E3 ubiquitin-protein ligase TRIM71 n=1 Tax=Oopsacas minuta TaxID=111878 RepID=A0AAV7KKU2_9METZ|nr:E3 ubiquitin-protein ligase TRIM71 [Oopsacas minuta]
MAFRYPIPPQVVDSIETHINYTIDRLIGVLNFRRIELLEKVRNAREDKKANELERQQMINQLTEAKANMNEILRQNPLQSMQERIVIEMEERLRNLRKNNPAETQFVWRCDTRDFETSISRLGEIVEIFVDIPDYAAFRMPTVAVGKKGSSPGELYNPFGVAIAEATNQIFVANFDNNRVEIFSDTGEYLNQLGAGQLYKPYGIAIHKENVYISSSSEHTVSKFDLTDMSLDWRIGGYGSDNGQLNSPRQLSTDPIGRVFIADCNNNRISVHDSQLIHIRNIKHQSMSLPFDVKVSHNRVFVLCPDNNPCMHVITLEGDKLQSLITSAQGIDTLRPWFFCIDRLNNFVLSELNSHSIRIFSPEGHLLHTIGSEGHQQGMFCRPRGIGITPNKRLVCVSDNQDYGIQFFY